MDFYKATKLNDIYFSKEGSFTTLMDLVGIEPGKVMDEDAKRILFQAILISERHMNQGEETDLIFLSEMRI